MEKKYFNNAGAGIMSEGTMNTVIEHMKLERETGAYNAAIIRSKEVAEFYEYSAKLLNAKNTEEIAYIDSASRGWNLIMYGINISSKDRIVTLETEYGTNLLTIYDIAKNKNCSVSVVKCEKNGTVNLEMVESELKNGGTILAVSHVAAQGSIVNPVVDLGKLAKKYGITYIVDGCQAVGQLKVDVQEIGCDAYVTAGRKWLRGPRGTGILYVKKDANIRTPQIDLASADLVFNSWGEVADVSIRKDAKQFELWEKNISALLGLTNAIKEYLELGIERVSKEISTKSNMIRNSINQNRNAVLVGKTESKTGVCGFYMKDASREKDVKGLFEKDNYIISIMCDWDCPIYFPKTGNQYIFRVSPHYYTEDAEVKAMCKFIEKIK